MSADEPYTLIWESSTFQELLAILSEDPRRINAARSIQQVESILSKDPHEQGEYLHEGLWRFKTETLSFFYEVEEDQRIIRITGVWRPEPRR
jgi:hypothetical protein